MDTRNLDFHLPTHLIAQLPTAERGASRLLHYRRDDCSIAHRQFSDLQVLLRTGDLLVMNDARVLPARLLMQKRTGGRIEGLFVNELSPGRWRVLLRDLGKYREPLRFERDSTIEMTIDQELGAGEFAVTIAPEESATLLLARVGRTPLPPYIRRDKLADERDSADRERYQTVYAATPGSIAAPTAGLHFTPELLDQLAVAGVERAMLTLHVGIGTFKPVTVDRLVDHAMHIERYSISPTTADAINRAKAEGRRVIAVGTTSARVLESQPAGQPIDAVDGETGIFIFPPYQWRHVDALVTNFHLPKSTLVALVAAMVGLDEQRRIYATAIEQRYRFFSYGDAMFIE